MDALLVEGVPTGAEFGAVLAGLELLLANDAESLVPLQLEGVHAGAQLRPCGTASQGPHLLVHLIVNGTEFGH